MPEWILLLPVVFPAIGILVIRVVTPRISPLVRPWLPPAFLTLEIIAILVNIAPFNHKLVISNWELARFSLAFQMDGIAVLLLLTMCVVLMALWLVSTPREPFDFLSTAILTAAILLTLAANLATIYFAWVILDIALFTWRLRREVEAENALRALAVSQLGGLALFAGSQYAGTPYPYVGSVLLALALWARLGLFPFHWLYPMRGADSRELWVARGIPLLAAASLWIRWAMFQMSAPKEWIAVLSAVALIVTVVWVWREEQPSRVVAAGVWHTVAFVPLAIAYGGDAAMAFALWLALSAAFALALLEMAIRWRAENRNRWARLLCIAGVFSLSGIPLTPAFLGRLGVYVSLWESGQGWVLLVALVATTLVLAPFWGFGLALEGTEPRDPTRSEYAGLVIMILACAALSFAPTLIAPALGVEMATSTQAALLRVIWTNDALGIGIGIVVLLLPLVLSFMLRRRAHEFRPQERSVVPRTGRLLDLDWLEGVVIGIGYEMGVTARNLSTLAEENPTVWILLVALWIAIFVMLPR